MRVVSTKYDGTLRDTDKAQLLDHIGSTVRLIVPAGTPVYGGKIDRVVEAEDDGIEFYFTDRRYNVSHFHEHTTWPNRWYSNVAAPASFDGDTLRWVDLDIDIRCYLDGSLRALDEDEFERNLVKMTNPDELVRQALAARDEVSGLGRVGDRSTMRRRSPTPGSRHDRLGPSARRGRSFAIRPADHRCSRGLRACP